MRIKAKPTKLIAEAMKGFKPAFGNNEHRNLLMEYENILRLINSIGEERIAWYEEHRDNPTIKGRLRELKSKERNFIERIKNS